VIFPEGTRVRAGEQKKFGVGGAMLATANGKLVVPMAHDAGLYWRRRGIMKKAGTIRVVIGKPIESTGKNPRDLTVEVRRAIELALARITH
jgi:1-acyl-sn-glycerol-3-phosphate acyltransferase